MMRGATLTLASHAAQHNGLGMFQIMSSARKVGLLGDSLSAMCNYIFTPTSITRTSNVATVTYASHGLANGAIICVFGVGSGYDASSVSITRIDANSFSYASTGADGSASISSTYSRVIAPSFTSNNSYFQYANSKLKGKLRLTGYYGQSSETTAMMLARVSTVVAGSEQTIIYLGGSNDAVGATTTAETISNDAAIVAALVAAGKKVIVASIPPLGSSHAQFATAEPKIKTINAAKKALVEQYRPDQVQYAPAFEALVDNTQSDGRAVSTYLQSDYIHLQASGAKRIGERAIYPALTALGYQPQETLVTTSYSANLWPIGQWQQVDAGTKSVLVNDPSPPTGSVAGVADGFNVTASGGAGYVYIAPDSDGYGYLQAARFTPSGAQTLTIQQESSTALNSSFTAGSQYRIGVRVKLTGVTSAASYFRVRFQAAIGGTTMALGTPLHSQTSGASNVGEDLDLYLMSEPFTWPSGAITSVTMEFITAWTGATTEHLAQVGRVTIIPYP